MSQYSTLLDVRRRNNDIRLFVENGGGVSIISIEGECFWYSKRARIAHLKGQIQIGFKSMRGSGSSIYLYKCSLKEFESKSIESNLDKDELSSLQKDPILSYILLNNVDRNCVVDSAGRRVGSDMRTTKPTREYGFYLLFDNILNDSDDYIYPHPSYDSRYRESRRADLMTWSQFKDGGEPIAAIVIVEKLSTNTSVKYSSKIITNKNSKIVSHIGDIPQDVKVFTHADEAEMLEEFIKLFQCTDILHGWKMWSDHHCEYSLSYIHKRRSECSPSRDRYPIAMDVFALIENRFIEPIKAFDSKLRLTEVAQFTYMSCSQNDQAKNLLPSFYSLSGVSTCQITFFDLRACYLANGKLDWKAVDYMSKCPLYLSFVYDTTQTVLSLCDHIGTFPSVVIGNSIYLQVMTWVRRRYMRSRIAYGFVDDQKYTRASEKTRIQAGSYPPFTPMSIHQSDDNHSIIELDAESMYPTMIILNNIGPTSLVLSDHENDEIEIETTEGNVSVSFSQLANDPLRDLLMDGINKRREAKQRSLRIMERVIKLINSATYGVLAMPSSTTTRLAMAAVTKISKYVYDRVLKSIRDCRLVGSSWEMKSPGDCKVIYGKTDSFYVVIPKTNGSTAESLALLLNKSNSGLAFCKPYNGLSFNMKLERNIEAMFIDKNDRYFVLEKRGSGSVLSTKGVIKKAMPFLIKSTIHHVMGLILKNRNKPKKDLLEIVDKSFNDACQKKILYTGINPRDIKTSNGKIFNYGPGAAYMRHIASCSVSSCTESHQVSRDPPSDDEETSQHDRESRITSFIESNRSYIPTKGDDIEYFEKSPLCITRFDKTMTQAQCFGDLVSHEKYQNYLIQIVLSIKR